MKRIPLHWKIIIGLFLGVLWGLLAGFFGFEKFTGDWVKPLGTIFMNLLQLIAVPLILASLIKGIASLNDIKKLSRIGGKTLFLYLATTVFAVTLGLCLANIIKPGKSFSEEKREEMKAKYASDITIRQEQAEKLQETGPLQFLVDLVPKNFIGAASQNQNMLQVIFFAIFFGICIVLLPAEQTDTVKKLFDNLNDIILKMIDVIMLFAPYGVFALMASIITDFGNDSLAELFTALFLYALSFFIGVVIIVLIFYPALIHFFTKLTYKQFIKGILPAQTLAFSTSSSAATLPVTMKCCEENLGISKEISGFVLPLGATVNMDGTSMYQAIAAVFIAQAFGFDLTITQQLTIILTATLASIGSAAVPGAGIVMLVVVLNSIGVDPEGIALIFAIDRILDMCRTIVNITGDCLVASIVAASEKNGSDYNRKAT
ncbi:MAG: dicarboxylate/amino acid:cation symporter [Bacteroidales bacterium]|nr:dicarboxylate/amino acid:cation symporter [Bacteroidales bacterium]